MTVWRELRRLGEVPEQAGQRDLFASLQDTADMSDWGMFYHLQGGPKVKRQDLPIKPFYVADSLGKYGDEVSRIHGLEWQSNKAGGWLLTQTRTHIWTVQRAGAAECNARDAEVKDYMSVERATAAFFREAGVSGFDGASAACPPRTRVNNCTQAETEPKPVFDFSGFEIEDQTIPYAKEGDRTGPIVRTLREARHLDAWHQQEAELWKSARWHQNQKTEFEKWQ